MTTAGKILLSQWEDPESMELTYGSLNCSFVSTIDPIYSKGQPGDSSASCTTDLEWSYTVLRDSIEMSWFRWEIPQQLVLDPGPSPSAIDLSGAPHFNSNDLRFSSIDRGGVHYSIVELASAMAMPEECQGVIRFHVRAADPGSVIVSGYWHPTGWGKWLDAYCSLTIE